MSIATLVSSALLSHFGGPTVSVSKDVGSGANRYAAALLGYTAASSQPAGYGVGSDTVPLIGSLQTIINGTKWGLYVGPLTVAGTQNLTGTYSGSFDSGFAVGTLLVVQGDAALTFANATTVVEVDIGSTGNTTVSVATATGEVFVLNYDIGFAATPTAHSPAIAVANDTGPPGFFISRQTASANPTVVQTDWSAAASVVKVGFSLTEAGAGGSSSLFRNNPGGNLSGLGSGGPFFQNPLQRVADVWKRRNGIFVPINYFNREALA